MRLNYKEINQSSVTDLVDSHEQQDMHTLDITELLKQVYLPRPEMPLSSLGSKDEEEEEG